MTLSIDEEKAGKNRLGDFCTFPVPSIIQWAAKRTMKLTVYSAPWCRDCHVAKTWLTKHKIPYTDINIEETPDAAEEVVKNTGKRAIPQFVLDGQWIQPYIPGQGFKYQEMAALFRVSEG